MFNELIERFGSNLGLSPEEALKSDLILNLCSDLVYGQIVIIESIHTDSLDMDFNIKKIDQNLTENFRDSDR
jgi:hypothetical protein